MAKTALAITVLVLALAPGCGAAKSALGALGGSKTPNNVTVVNEIHVPAPAAPAPAPAPAPVEKRASPRRALLGGAIAGSLVGGLIGATRGVDLEHIATGAAVGAAAGAGAGYVLTVTQ